MLLLLEIADFCLLLPAFPSPKNAKNATPITSADRSFAAFAYWPRAAEKSELLHGSIHSSVPVIQPSANGPIGGWTRAEYGRISDLPDRVSIFDSSSRLQLQRCLHFSPGARLTRKVNRTYHVRCCSFSRTCSDSPFSASLRPVCY